MRSARAQTEAGKVDESRALLLRSVPQGDSSAIATYFTEAHGKVTFALRAVRQSRKRMPLALEPFHTLRLRYKPRRASDVWSLESAELVTPRLSLSEDLDVSFAAGSYLRWLSALTAPRQPDAELYAEAETQLDRLASEGGTEAWLLHAGVRLMAHAGYELELRACVACGRPRPAGRKAHASTERGGIICRACATGEHGPPVAAPFVLEPAVLAILEGTHIEQPTRPQLETAKRFLEAALLAHTEVSF